MKNYTKIPFNKITDIESYVEEKLKAGHIIIQILVNEDQKEIDELISYANDKGCESYYRNICDSDEQLRNCVITESLEPYYAFRDDKREERVCCCDIDIETDSQNIVDFQSVKEDFSNREKEFYNGISFQYDGEIMHCEFYISNDIGDIANFGGNMEIEFVTEWMKEQGYYNK